MPNSVGENQAKRKLAAGRADVKRMREIGYS